MLTGYNTDVSYGGEVFHVQTEDKGIQTPIILSLVYRAGTILAAKRTNYDSCIQNGIVDEAAVAQILSKQHHLLVAAIKSGKSHKLAELSRHYQDQRQKQVAASKGPAGPVAAAAAAPVTVASEGREGAASARQVITEKEARPAPPAMPLVTVVPVVPVKVEVVAPPAKEAELPGFDQIISGYLQSSATPDRLRIELLYPSKFVAGDEITVRAAVLCGGHSPVSNAVVKLQILGTRIDPQHLTARTDFQGLVGFTVKLPTFTCGAAALVLTAKESTGQETEVKYMIRKK